MRYLTPQEVAEILRVSLKTVYERLGTGEIKGMRVGRQWRILEDDLFPQREAPGKLRTQTKIREKAS